MPSNTIITTYFKSPIGELIVGETNGKLCMADWRYRKMRSAVDKRLTSFLNAEMKEGDSAIIQQAMTELNEYFEGSRTSFSVPLELAGSDFQKNVWNALMDIPYGQTCSYLDLTKQLGDEKAIRAVAAANGANAISIIVPCHRIIGSNGDLTGYAGGLAAKKKLLQLEKADVMQQTSLF